MTPEEMKRRSRGWSTDMSGEAIARRVDIVSELRAVGLWLAKARRIGRVEEGGTKGEPPPEDKGEQSPDRIKGTPES